MSLKDKQPEEVLCEERLPEYEARREAVWRSLTEFHTAILLGRRTSDFPADLFLGEVGGSIFWRKMGAALLESCVLRIWHLTEDDGGERYASIRRFRNFVIRKAIRPEFRAQLQEQLRTARFSRTVEDAFEKAKELRDNLLAHLDTSLSETELRRMQFGSLEDLETTREELGALFEVLCFGFGHATLPLAYVGEICGKPVETDVDKVMLAIASSSPCLKLPEEQPEEWRSIRAELSPRDLEAVNAWRERLGLSPA